MLNVFCSPSRYVQGPGASGELVAELQRLGLRGPTLLIASASARRLLEAVWRESFARADTALTVMEFGGECSSSEIARCRDEARRVGAVVIVGAGGGKVLDTARAAASEQGVPVACCPTVAASDAPCSALSIVYTPDGIFERSIVYRRNPDLVLVDTAIIARAPVRLLIAGMGDALATRFEAETSRRAHRANQVGGTSTLAAAAIADLCYETLIRDGAAAVAAVRVGAVTPALERIVEANTLLSGLGFESGGLAMAHSIHNGLTALARTHDRLHGEKVAFGTLVQLVLEGRESTLIEEVMGFCQAVGLPMTLADLGLDEFTPEQARVVAERALAEGETAHNEPFRLSPEKVMDALLATDAWSRAFRSRCDPRLTAR